MTKIGGIFFSQDKVFACVAVERGSTVHNPTLDILSDLNPVYQSTECPDWDNSGSIFDSVTAAFAQHQIDRVSVASFGPFESLDHENANYGRLTHTQPQNLLRGLNISDALTKRFGWENHHDRVFINTDVNCGAIAEFSTRYTHHEYPFQELASNEKRRNYLVASSSLVYVIIGHGIGAGQTWGGSRVRDRMNPEMGHAPIQRHPDDKIISSRCNFHESCVEGYAGNKTHVARLTVSSRDHADRLRVDYIAQFIGAIHVMLAPNAIVVDGPYSGRDQVEFLSNLRSVFQQKMGGPHKFYPAQREIVDLESYISPPLCDSAPVKGALYMATSSFRSRVNAAIRDNIFGF